MSASRTAHVRLASGKLAMAVYRRFRFTEMHLEFPWYMTAAIASAVADYENRSPRAVDQLVQAHPDMLIEFAGGSRTLRGWLRQMAEAIIAQEIQQIVGISPRFADCASDYWVFLGGDLRDHQYLPLTQMQRDLQIDENNFVEYWGGRDGMQVKVVYGRGQFEYVAGHVDDLDKAGWHVREAFRRLGLSRIDDGEDFDDEPVEPIFFPEDEDVDADRLDPDSEAEWLHGRRTEQYPF